MLQNPLLLLQLFLVVNGEEETPRMLTMKEGCEDGGVLLSCIY